ncbi:porin [Thiohalocapsa marina]|nr:porin [Thiohalocapsa marina]
MSDIEQLRQEIQKQRELLDQQQRRLEELERQTLAQAERLEKQSVQVAEVEKTARSKSGNLAPGVTLYGILDGGVEHLNNIGENKDSDTRFVSVTGTLPSRLGLRVKKEFGEGYQALATLEAGFNFDDGSQGQGGRLFGRQLFAGIATPKFGTFTIGRQYSMLLPALVASDMLSPNIYSLSSLDFYLPNARYDNSLAWKGKFNKLSLGAAYSFGRDVIGGTPGSGTCAGETSDLDQSTACQGWSTMIRYDDSNFGLAAAIDELNGGTGATAFAPGGAAPILFDSEDDTDRRINAGGYYKLGNGKLGLGWLGRRIDTRSGDVDVDAFYVTGSYKFGAFTLDGGIHKIDQEDIDGIDRDAMLYVLRGMYNLHEGLDIYAQLGHVANDDDAAYQVSLGGGATAPPAGESQTGVMTGMRFMF